MVTTGGKGSLTIFMTSLNESLRGEIFEEFLLDGSVSLFYAFLFKACCLAWLYISEILMKFAASFSSSCLLSSMRAYSICSLSATCSRSGSSRMEGKSLFSATLLNDIDWLMFYWWLFFFETISSKFIASIISLAWSFCRLDLSISWYFCKEASLEPIALELLRLF